MNYEQISRDIRAVVAQVQLEYTDFALKVEIDNRDVVDLVTQTDPFLKLEIDYLPGGGQMTLEHNPIVRQVGQIALYAVDKGGAGTAGTSKLLTALTTHFASGVSGVVRWHPPQAVRGKAINGWWHQPLLIDFWVDAAAA